MNKIFRYELRRLLWNKLFFGILLVSLGYGWLTLTGSVIRGVAHTAPFSPWSFGYYLSQTLPLICLGELFFLAFFSSREERLLRPLTQATPIKQKQYMALRCGAVLTATAILCLCLAALAILFYIWLFGWMNYGKMILPSLLILLPAVVFCLGIGLALCQFHPALIYLFVAVIFLLSLLPLPSTVSFSLSSFFLQYPLTLNILDPAFQIPLPLILQRCAYSILGILGIIYANRFGKKTR